MGQPHYRQGKNNVLLDFNGNVSRALDPFKDSVHGSTEFRDRQFSK